MVAMQFGITGSLLTTLGRKSATSKKLVFSGILDVFDHIF
jgi:hypothetical protein